jgi:hypothetical protein
MSTASCPALLFVQHLALGGELEQPVDVALGPGLGLGGAAALGQVVELGHPVFVAHPAARLVGARRDHVLALGVGFLKALHALVAGLLVRDVALGHAGRDAAHQLLGVVAREFAHAALAGPERIEPGLGVLDDLVGVHARQAVRLALTVDRAGIAADPLRLGQLVDPLVVDGVGFLLGVTGALVELLLGRLLGIGRGVMQRVAEHLHVGRIVLVQTCAPAPTGLPAGSFSPWMVS